MHEMQDQGVGAVRKRMMAGIGAADTKPELLVRKALHAAGFRYRLHVKNLPGKPDIVLPRYRTVVLVNGCFWHGHDCRYFKWPKSREEFWRQKITRNQERDVEVSEKLIAEGWRVFTVWECAFRSGVWTEGQLIDRFRSWLCAGSETSCAIGMGQSPHVTDIDLAEGRQQ